MQTLGVGYVLRRMRRENTEPVEGNKLIFDFFLIHRLHIYTIYLRFTINYAYYERLSMYVHPNVKISVKPVIVRSFVRLIQ